MIRDIFVGLSETRARLIDVVLEEAQTTAGAVPEFGIAGGDSYCHMVIQAVGSARKDLVHSARGP